MYSDVMVYLIRKRNKTAALRIAARKQGTADLWAEDLKEINFLIAYFNR